MHDTIQPLKREVILVTIHLEHSKPVRLALSDNGTNAILFNGNRYRGRAMNLRLMDDLDIGGTVRQVGRETWNFRTEMPQFMLEINRCTSPDQAAFRKALTFNRSVTIEMAEIGWNIRSREIMTAIVERVDIFPVPGPVDQAKGNLTLKATLRMTHRADFAHPNEVRQLALDAADPEALQTYGALMSKMLDYREGTWR